MKNFFQGFYVLLGMDYIKGIGGVEIDVFGTVSIVRKPCIWAFVNNLALMMKILLLDSMKVLERFLEMAW